MGIAAVMIDQREPDWVKRMAFGDALVAVTLLECSDFRIACDDGEVLLVERKTASDLLASIADGRLLHQSADMARASRWSYLLITGALEANNGGKVVADGILTGWSFEAVQGALLSVQELGVFVIWCAGNSDIEPAMARLAARNRDASLVVAPARAPSILGAGEAALAALPGIGLDRLDNLLRACDTPARALVFLTDPAANGVPGIGPATKANVRKALSLAVGETLTIITTGA